MPSSKQHNGFQVLTHSPSLSIEAAALTLSRIVTSGTIQDDDLQARVARLARSFRAYALSSPVPFWAPGLVVTDEMRRITEGYIPYDEVRGALIRLCRVALKGEHSMPPLLEGVHSWLDLLNLLPGDISCMDPSSMLTRLLTEPDVRKRFLFSLHLPARYGGAFGRYPEQTAFLCDWLNASGEHGLSPIRILDAACGCGEGVYELAALCLETGFTPETLCITGATISPLEIYAAAHACFPHDICREDAFRRFVQPLHESGAALGIRFVAADIQTWRPEEPCHVIVCNGLLGGPMMHGREGVERCVNWLAGNLARGGILLAANRFHRGWHKAFPHAEMERIFQRCGLSCLHVGEGVAGVLQ
jgi:chemotaxis methyl-accepting protein methylase